MALGRATCRQTGKSTSRLEKEAQFCCRIHRKPICAGSAHVILGDTNPCLELRPPAPRSCSCWPPAPGAVGTSRSRSSTNRPWGTACPACAGWTRPALQRSPERSKEQTPPWRIRRAASNCLTEGSWKTGFLQKRDPLLGSM